MIETPMSFGGMVTAPHHLAAQAGRDVLRAGGTAVEAAVAMAAVLSVVYPHMSGLGGDGYWLISDGPGRPPVAIHGAGRAGTGASLPRYLSDGHDSIPERGPLAALTVPGTVSGWQAALAQSRGWQAPLPLAQLLEQAISHAENGIAVTASQARLTRRHLDDLAPQPGFAETFLVEGAAPDQGHRLRLPALAATLRRLADAGLDDFYTGQIARSMAADMARAGCPVTETDIARHSAEVLRPLSLRLKGVGATVWNTRPPTQGLASLILLGVADRLELGTPDSFAHLHGCVEATKQAFDLRNRHVSDPATMHSRPELLLQEEELSRRVARVDPARAAPWPHPAAPGDTTWLGVVDGMGRSVSFIQSIFHEFGSGVVLPETGIVMQNRGASFRLSTSGMNRLAPGRLPFTTLNPAMAQFDDGRLLSYGTMGGDGQPQTQAAIFLRMAKFGMRPQAAINAPRWLLGRSWGAGNDALKLESGLPEETVAALRAAGHDVQVLGRFDSMMGHAGAILRGADGLLEGGTDPRSDGAVAAL